MAAGRQTVSIPGPVGRWGESAGGRRGPRWRRQCVPRAEQAFGVEAAGRRAVVRDEMGGADGVGPGPVARRGLRVESEQGRSRAG